MVEKIRKQGGNAHIVNNLDDAKNILQGLKNVVDKELTRISKKTNKKPVLK